MDGVGISIIERPRPLPGHDTPNPTQHPYTLKCEEPLNNLSGYAVPIQIRRTYPDATPRATPRPNIRIGNEHPDRLRTRG